VTVPVPPPHLLKKFSAQARESSQKRGAPNYLKTFATLCIEWAMNSKPTPNPSQIRSSEIKPTPELVQQWLNEIWHEGTPVQVALSDEHIATRAAQWGADQELEACCLWVNSVDDDDCFGANLRSARRPKPPSFKEQALETFKYPKDLWSEAEVDTIRRALEALPDD